MVKAHEQEGGLSRTGQGKFGKRINNGESSMLPLHTLVSNRNSQYSKLQDMDMQVQGCQNATQQVHKRSQMEC